MKNYRTDKETGMMIFYVMLDEQIEKKPRHSFIPFSKGNLTLVVNR